MAVRSQHSRQSTNTVSLKVEDIYITLIPKDWTVPKSKLYSVKKNILNGKIVLPSIETKTGISPFLIGYCSKGVEFVWN